jgi:hypothetical protein
VRAGILPRRALAGSLDAQFDADLDFIHVNSLFIPDAKKAATAAL